MAIRAYRVKSKKLAGTNYSEIYKKAHSYYEKIRKRSKRRTYVRSSYFNKDKIFLAIFWQHLHEKWNLKDKTRRVKYFICAIDLIQNGKFDPISKENPNKRTEMLHRFAGVTQDEEIFFIHIKEDKKTSQKYLISIFPSE